MHWRRRAIEWLAVLREQKRTTGRLPWWTMVKAILGGTVPRRVWRQRMRTCLTCPIFSKGYRCKSTHPDFKGAGCGCYVPFTALTAEPYHGGCWAKATFPDGPFGWPAYPIRWWERPLSVIRFLLRR